MNWLQPVLVIATIAVAGWACNPAPRVPPPPDTGPELEAIELQQQLKPSVRLGDDERATDGWSLRERMDHYGVPGVAVAVIDDGELRFAKAWGVTSAGGDEPVTPTTRFQGSSIAKALTATLVLRLADQGRLDLDTAVAPWANGVDPAGVTPRRLLSHTAGIGVASFAGYPPGEPLPTLGQILAGTPPAISDPITVVIEPGTAWRYSGGGYQVLQHAVETLTDEPFATTLHDELFAPLGMTSSLVGPLPDALAATAATGHDRQGAPLPGRWRVYPEAAAAGLWTSAEDLSRWVIDLQKAHAGKPARRLRRDMARAMFEPMEPGDWGLGVLRGGTGQAAWFGHLGGNAGFPAAVIGFVSSGHGAVVLTNGDGGFGLIREIVTALAELYDWPTFGSITHTATTPSSETLARLVGAWTVPAIDATLRVEWVDDTLWASFLGQRARLVAVGDRHFVDLEEGWSLTIDDDRLTIDLWPGYRLGASRADGRPAAGS